MYCEKPLANNLMEAKTLMDVVGKSKIIFQVGSQQRADREFRYACELVRNGYLRQRHGAQETNVENIANNLANANTVGTSRAAPSSRT